MIISELHIKNCRELAELALQTGQVSLTQAEHLIAIIARFTALSKLPKEQQISPIATVGADIETLASIAEFTNRHGKLSLLSAANIHRTLSELVELHNTCLTLVAESANSEKSESPAHPQNRQQRRATAKPAAKGSKQQAQAQSKSIDDAEDLKS